MEFDGRRPGFVCGMAAEARCLPESEAMVVCAGGDPARAQAGAADLVARGATALVSFGLAGGLDPRLGPGDLVLAEAVILPGGGRIETDRAWHQSATAAASLAGSQGGPVIVSTAALAGSNRAVVSAAAKRLLFESTGAVAVDMESHGVAAAAQAAGVPFLIVRAVADPAARGIPALALAGLGPDGSLRPGRVVPGLLRRPWHLAALLRLAADSRAGLKTLRRVAAPLFRPMPGPPGRPA